MTGPSRPRQGKPILAGASGSIVEWYDFAIYGYFAVTLSKEFFPEDDSYAALIAIFGIFAVSNLMRPLGGIVFGHIGDRIGRRAALRVSILTMGVSTTSMALLPTFDQVGLLAPVLLTVARLLQGLSIGGEYASASIYVAESVRPERRGLLSSIVESATDFGFLFGTIIGALTAWILGELVMQAWGWRLPFLLGGLLAFAVLLIRNAMPESPEAESLRKDKRTPLILTFTHFWREQLLLAALVAFSGVTTSIAFIYGTAYFEQVRGFSIALSLGIGSLSGLTMIAAALAVGHLSDLFGRRPLWMAVGVAGAVLGWPLFWLLHQDELALLLLAQIGLGALSGAGFGLLPATMAEVFPSAIRVTGSAFGYNLSVGLLGGLAPLLSTAVTHWTGDLAAPGFFILAGAITTLIGAFFLSHQSGQPLSSAS